MDRISTAMRFVPAASKNERLEDLTEDFLRRDNAHFLAEVAGRLTSLQSGPDGEWFSGGSACIGLLGAYGLVGATLRQAQAVLRVDRTASNWAHAFLLYDDLASDPAAMRSRTSSPWIWESSLHPRPPFHHALEAFGVGARRVADYREEEFEPLQEFCVPNMAVIAIGLRPEERSDVLARANSPQIDQLGYDLSTLLGIWHAYVCDPSRPNPLAEGQALFCAAYLQLAYDAAGIDLAPGGHDRNIAPEHIWQLAKYLHEVSKVPGAGPQASARPVAGWYCVREPSASIAPPPPRIDGKAGPERLPRNLRTGMQWVDERTSTRGRADSGPKR